MRIDAHHHFWIYDALRDSWITDDMKKIRRDFLPKDLVPLLKENAFDGCIAIQADSSEEETDFLLDFAGHQNAIKGVVGWTDLCSPDVESRLEQYAGSEYLKGFRHVVQGESDDQFLLRDDFCRGVSSLQKYNLTYDLLIYPKHLTVAEKFVTLFPDQKFVLDHMAKPLIRSKHINDWAADIARLARHKNVHCKVSGFVTEADWKTWSYNDIVPYLEVVVDCFGTDRIMYGSDWPVCLVAGAYRDQLNVTEKYFRTFLDHERDAIFGGNATRFYNID